MNTPRVRITGAALTSKGAIRQVVNRRSDDLTLFMYLSIDTTLWDEPLPIFRAGFRIIEASTGSVKNHYWVADLTALPRAPNIWLSMSFGTASSAGIALGAYESPYQQDGLYCFRPAFSILQSNQSAVFWLTGLSHFAVGDDHYFMVERGP